MSAVIASALPLRLPLPSPAPLPPPLPLYAQLKETLIQEIADGSLLPGTRIPSQRDLAAQYGLSHMTVRRALSELTLEGVLFAIPGKGIYVAEREKQTAESDVLLSFTEDMRRRGFAASSRVLNAEIITASTPIARVLEVEFGAALVWLQRLRLADNQPVAIQTTYLPHALFPDLLAHDFAHESLYSVLKDVYGTALDGGDQAVEATLADEDSAALLAITLPAALLITEQTTRDSTGRAVEYVRSVYRADRYRMQIKQRDTVLHMLR